MAEFMEKAVKLSIENVKNQTGGPFGCVITRKGEIVAEGSNKVTVWNDPTAHAEVVAIRNACKELGTFNLSDCELYTSCFPCPMCYGAIRWARLGEVYYANTKQDAHNIGFSDLDIYESIVEKRENLTHLHNENAITAFKMWQDASAKVEY